MPDVVFRIRTEGDIKQFLGSIQNSANSYMQRTNKELEQLFTGRMGNMFSGGFGAHGTGFGKEFVQGLNKVGPAIRMASIEVDGFNNRLKIMAETGLRLGEREFIPTGKYTTFTGNAKGYVEALGKIAVAETNLATTRARNQREESRIRGVLDSTVTSERSRISAPFQTQMAGYTTNRGVYATEHARLKAMVDAYKKFGATVPTTIATEYGRVTRAMNAQGANIANASNRMNAALAAGMDPANNSLIARARARLVSFGQLATADESAAVRAVSGAKTAATQQMYATPSIPANIQATLDSSKQLRDMLLKAGLGGGFAQGTEGFAKAVQSANFSTPYVDLTKGVTRVSGEFENAAGKAFKFGSEIDKSGKPLTRFGGQLSGVSNFLRMVQRDFMKVIEWTVATTVVFASMGAIVSTIKQINEVDKLLNRFAITAQMTAEETRGYFSELAKVAYETATPLNEMISVADDLALATKETGQTTAEWTRRISEMSVAVGILTNIAGVETTVAADTLTATMKQLGVSTGELIPILNKVSAVAGGQQQAISDITRGLSVMAEAGNQAGLSVDQQIATIQVLSQVTSKSSAEVATSFKNLVGSIDSPGSIRILTEFGIQVRDAEGNARNFLDIYKDISDALDQGIIPQGRLKEVIRGVSGGPRRAPDAAALLSNVNTIFEVEKVSVGAANEALLANAKMLDTNSAKLTQIGVKIDQLAFEKFAAILRETVGDFSGVLTDIIDAFSGIDNGIMQTVLQLTAMVVILKLISVAGKGIHAILTALGATSAAVGATFKGWGPALVAAKLQINEIANRVRVLGVGGAFQYGGGMKGLYNKLTSPGAIAVGLGAVAGATMSGREDPMGMLGGALQQGGLMTALVAPLPQLKVLGLGVAALGTVMMSLSEAVKTVNAELNKNSEEMLNAATAYTQTSSTIKDLESQQKQLISQMFVLQGETNVESMNARIDVQNKLAEVTTSLYNANSELTKSYKDLNAALAEGDEGALKNLSDATLQAAKSGRMSLEEVNRLRSELELAYLKNAYPSEYIDPRRLGDNQPIVRFGESLLPGTSQAIMGAGSAIGAYQRDINDMSTDEFKKLFQEELSPEGPTGRYEIATGVTIPKNIQSVAAAWAQVAIISQTNAADAQIFADALYRAGLNADNITEAAMGYERLQARINSKVAVGQLSQEQGLGYMTNYRFLQAALVSTENLPDNPSTLGFGSYKENNIKTIEDAINNYSKTWIPGTQDFEKLVDALDEIVPGLKEMDDVTRNMTLQSLGLNILFVGDTAKSAAAEVEDLEEAIGKLQDASDAIQSSLAGTSASLYDQYIAGDLTEAKYGRLQERLDGFRGSAETLFKALEDQPAIKGVEDLGTALKEKAIPGFEQMIEKLIQIPGFEDAASWSMQELTQKVADYGMNQNLSTQEAKWYGDMLKWLITVINALQTYKLFVYEVRTVYTAVGGGAMVSTGGAGSASNTIHNRAMARYRAKYGTTPKNTQEPRWEAILEEERARYNNQQRAGAAPVGSPPRGDAPLPGSSPTSGGGGGGGGGSSRNIGSLDIPDEFKSDPKSLVAKAVAWARKYQKAIPGETAAHRSDLVAIMNGNNRILLQRGISEEYLRKAMQELADQIKKQNELLMKADTIRRIRVGAGDFASIANVPMNSKSGISVGGPGQPINVNLNINGQVMTPAQFQQLANAIAAQIKKSYQNS